MTVAPRTSVLTHLEAETTMLVDIFNEAHTLSLSGDDYGGLSIFFHSLDQMSALRDTLTAHIEKCTP